MLSEPGCFLDGRRIRFDPFNGGSFLGLILGFAVLCIVIFLVFWLGNPRQKLLQVFSLEQSVAIGWIPVHRELAVGRPDSDSFRRDPQDLGRLCNFHRFIQFGHDSPSNRWGVDMRLEFSKLYGTMTALPIP